MSYYNTGSPGTSGASGVYPGGAGGNGTTGGNELHATYVDQSGNGIDATVTSIREAGHPLSVRRLGAGHYVADATLTRGGNGFDIAAVSGCEQLASHLDIDIGSSR